MTWPEKTDISGDYCIYNYHVIRHKIAVSIGSSSLSFQARKLKLWEVNHLVGQIHTVIVCQIKVFLYVMDLLSDCLILLEPYFTDVWT